MQKQKVLVLFIVAFLSLNLSRAQDTTSIGSSLTLKQSVDIAIRYNLQVWTGEYQMKTSKVQFNQAKDNVLPNISANGSYGVNFGRSINNFDNSYINQQINVANYGVNASLLLFSGLQVFNNIKQTAYAYDASKMDW